MTYELVYYSRSLLKFYSADNKDTMERSIVEAMEKEAAASPTTCADSLADLPTQEETAPADQRPQLQGHAVFSSFVAKPPSDFTEDQHLVCQDCKK